MSMGFDNPKGADEEEVPAATACSSGAGGAAGALAVLLLRQQRGVRPALLRWELLRRVLLLCGSGFFVSQLPKTSPMKKTQKARNNRLKLGKNGHILRSRWVMTRKTDRQYERQYRLL